MDRLTISADTRQISTAVDFIEKCLEQHRISRVDTLRDGRIGGCIGKAG